MTDVLIIGAGPTGCTAAKVLSRRGYCVTIVERCHLPRNKSCSGVLIGKTIDSIQRIFQATIPDQVKCTPFVSRGMIFFDDGGKEYRFEQEGLNIWRQSFDAWLLSECRGVTVIDGTNVCDCTQDDVGVTVSLGGRNAHTVQAAYVIDCGGIADNLPDKLFGKARDTVSTYQTFFRGTSCLDPQYFYAFLQPDFSDYDAWYNVKDDMTAIGVAARDRSKLPAYFRNFVEYLQQAYRFVPQEKIRDEKWLLPQIQPGCPIQHGCGRILSAGEAAGFLNPMGEGISSGIESGAAVALSLAANFSSPERVLADYSARTEELRQYMLRQWDLVARLSGTFAHMRRHKNREVTSCES